MRDRDNFYGDEDQNNIMELIDSADHPSEPQKSMTTEDYIEKFSKQVNDLRREINTLALHGKDAGDLIKQLAKAEADLDAWIDIRVDARKISKEPMPF